MWRRGSQQGSTTFNEKKELTEVFLSHILKPNSTDEEENFVAGFEKELELREVRDVPGMRTPPQD